MRGAAPLLTLAAACGAPIADGDLSVQLGIAAVIPERIPRRGGVEVTVLGWNFEPGMVVTVGAGGAEIAAQVFDGGRLRFVAPPLELGFADIALRAPGGRKAERARAIRVFAEISRLRPEAPAFIGGALDEIAAGDVDGDGLADLAGRAPPRPFAPGSAGVTILLNRRGGFEPTPAQVGASTVAGGLVLSDLDGDGLADLFDGRRLWRATGGGAFSGTPLADLGTSRGRVRTATAGRFDGRRNELIVFWPKETTRVALGPSGASITGTAIVQDATQLAFDRAEVADLNLDGKDDLVPVGTKVHLGPGLDELLAWTTGVAFTLLDMNGDQAPDLVMAAGGQLSGRAGAGDGTFFFIPTPATGAPCGRRGPISFLDNDGAGGIAAGCQDDLQTFAWRDARLVQPDWPEGLKIGEIVEGEAGRRSVFADFDGDGANDLAATDGTRLFVRSAVRGVPGVFTAHEVVGAGGDCPLVLAAYGAHDGAPARSAAVGACASLSLFDASPSGLVRRGAALDLGAPIVALASCDLEGDGAPDVLAAVQHKHEPAAIVFARARGGALERGERVALGFSGPLRLHAGDLDGTGRCVILAVNGAGEAAELHRESSGWTRRPAGAARASLGLNAAVRGGGGPLDLIGTTSSSSAVWIRAGEAEPVQVVLQDTALDWLDAMLLPGDPPVVWLLGQSAPGERFVVRGRLTPSGVIADPEALAIGGEAGTPRIHPFDLDGDGISDAFIAPSSASCVEGSTGSSAFVVRVLAGGDLAPFGEIPLAARTIPAGCWSDPIALDVDLDGLEDVVFSNDQLRGKLAVLGNASE